MMQSNSNQHELLAGKAPDRFLFIIGAMKSGTTSLFDILSQHPAICPAKDKEPNFFVQDRDRKALGDYLNLWGWNTKAGHKYALESSVAYTKVPFVNGVPERMAQAALGEYRFIYLIRDPFSRIESQVRHSLFAGWGKSLDAGMQQDVIEFSRYAIQMDEYLRFFPKQSLFPVVLEDFKHNPHRVLEEICAFLEIDRHYHFDNVAEPRNSGEFFETHPLIRKLSQNRLVSFVVGKLLPFRFKKWLRKKIAAAGRKTPNKQELGRWRLTENEKYDVFEQLSPDLKRLESEYGIDIHKYWYIPSERAERNSIQ